MDVDTTVTGRFSSAGRIYSVVGARGMTAASSRFERDTVVTAGVTVAVTDLMGLC